MDDNDSVDFRDGWDEPAAAPLNRLFGDTPIARWEHSRSIYATAAPNARFVLVPDVGHDSKALQHLAVTFFEEFLSHPSR